MKFIIINKFNNNNNNNNNNKSNTLSYALGSCRQVLFASLVTNSWYLSTQDDRGLQAKHNTIFVIFVSKDKQYFAPANPHIKEQNDIIDKATTFFLKLLIFIFMHI